MLKHIVYVLLILSGFAISLAGCGSDTSGSISLGSLTNSGDVVTATATYSPSSGSALTNQKITFYWRTVGLTTNITVDYPPEDASTDSTGSALSELRLPSPRSETMRVYVKAATGDLTTGSQSVDVLK